MDNGPQLTAEDSANLYFFPSGDGFGNTTTTAYSRLSVPANVTATVLNSSNTVVKTLLGQCLRVRRLALSHLQRGPTPEAAWSPMAATPSRSSPPTMPGAPRLPRAPGGERHTGPAHHADRRGHPVGTAGFVFTPEFVVHRHLPHLPSKRHLPRHRHVGGENGTWQGSGDTTDCANGAATLNDTVSVTDPLGNAQTWSDPNPPSVTIDNENQLTAEDSANLYFFPVR